MKKISLLLLGLSLMATSCATISVSAKKQTANNIAPPVYYTGMDEPAAALLRTAEQDNE
jgi:hypothetical protein